MDAEGGVGHDKHLRGSTSAFLPLLTKSRKGLNDPVEMNVVKKGPSRESWIQGGAMSFHDITMVKHRSSNQTISDEQQVD